jgi:hypothetical protein
MMPAAPASTMREISAAAMRLMRTNGMSPCERAMPTCADAVSRLSGACSMSRATKSNAASAAISIVSMQGSFIHMPIGGRSAVDPKRARCAGGAIVNAT